LRTLGRLEFTLELQDQVLCLVLARDRLDAPRRQRLRNEGPRVQMDRVFALLGERRNRTAQEESQGTKRAGNQRQQSHDWTSRTRWGRVTSRRPITDGYRTYHVSHSGGLETLRFKAETARGRWSRGPGGSTHHALR